MPTSPDKPSLDISTQVFKLREGDEFIPLNKLLKLVNLAQTGGHARILITDGDVYVNDKVESQIRKKIRSGDKVRLNKVVIEIS